MTLLITSQPPAQPVELWYAIKILDGAEGEKARNFYRTRNFETCQVMLAEARNFKPAWVEIEDRHGNPYDFDGQTVDM